MTTTTLPLPWWALALHAVLLIALGWCAAYARLVAVRDRIADQIGDLKRLTSWQPKRTTTITLPAVSATAWPTPLHPRDHEVELARRDHERQMLAFAARGRAPVAGGPPAIDMSAYRDGPSWAPRETDTGRRWVTDTQIRTDRKREAAAHPGVWRRLWTGVLLWLAMHEPMPEFWTEQDLPDRDRLRHRGRHRAPERDPAGPVEPAPAEPPGGSDGDGGDDPAWTVPTGEFNRAATELFNASLLVSVVRGAR